MKIFPLYLVALSMSTLMVGHVSINEPTFNEPTFNEERLNDGSNQIGTIYRWTKNGWEDSTIWEMNQPVPSSFFEDIHPLIWGTTTLILALIGLLWMTRETEVDRLFTELDQFLEESLSSITSEKK